MRGATPPPPTEGARGRYRCSDAHICMNVRRNSGTFAQERTCETSGEPATNTVQGHVSEVSSGAGAADNGRSHRYMYGNESGGRKHKKKKKKKSRWRRFDGESAREYEERMEVDMVRDLEEAYEGLYTGRRTTGARTGAKDVASVSPEGRQERVGIGTGRDSDKR